MLDETLIDCPYCGEAQTLLVDTSVGDACYTEDCQVCCQPMRVSVTLFHPDEAAVVRVQREDD